MRELGNHVAIALLLVALVGCTEPPPERLWIADLHALRLVSSGEALFAASRTPDGYLIHEIRGGELVPVFTIPRHDAEMRELSSLVAISSGELYWTYDGAAECAPSWSCISIEPDRIGRWDGTEVGWIDMPGGVILESSEGSVWAQARDGDEQVLFRIEGGRAIETRRDAYDENVYVYAVLPSGHAVRSTRAFGRAQEIDETGAVRPFPTGVDVYVRDGWNIEVRDEQVTFARDGRRSVSVPLRGQSFVGTGPGSADGLDWVHTSVGVEYEASNGEAITSRYFVVEHFDGGGSSERFRTEWADYAYYRGYGAHALHGGSLFYTDEGVLYEQPLR